MFLLFDLREAGFWPVIYLITHSEVDECVSLIISEPNSWRKLCATRLLVSLMKL